MAGETGVDQEGPSPPGPSNSISWVGPGDLMYNENVPFLLLLDCFSATAIRPVSMGTLKPLSGVIKLTLPIETPVIHVQGGFKVPMETGRNLEHTTERHQRGFKVPMETGS